MDILNFRACLPGRIYLFLHSKYPKILKINFRELFFKVPFPLSSVGEKMTSYFTWEGMFSLGLVYQLEHLLNSNCPTTLKTRVWEVGRTTLTIPRLMACSRVHANEWASLAHTGVASLHPRVSPGEELSIFTLSCAQHYGCHAPNQAVGGEMADRSPEHLKTESKR